MDKQEINTETYLKKKKIKRENMGRIDISTCLEKRSKDKKNIKNIIAIQKSLNISSVFCCYLRHTTNIIIIVIVILKSIQIK